MRMRAAACGMIVALSGMVGCSKDLSTPPSTTVSQPLPFDRTSAESGIAPTANLVPRGIQVGTRIAVRLGPGLVNVRSRPGDSFAAELDEPIFFEGRTLTPRGTVVTGKVLAANAPVTGHDAGYLRLTVVSITVDDKAIPVHTSAATLKRGNGVELVAGAKEAPGHARVEPKTGFSGRHFTVRLTEPILLPN